MLHIKFLDVGVNPLTSSSKCNPLVAPAIIAGAGSMLGGLFGAAGSAKAAKYQLQAARETNQMNYQIAQENNAFNQRMWEKQNAYNSPVEQRRRLEQAGLNPNLMMNGGSAGTAETAPTADTSGVQQVPDIGSTIASGYQQFGSSLSNAASQIAGMVYNNGLQQANVNKAQAEAQSASQDARYKELQNRFAASQFLADLREKLYRGLIAKTDYDFCEILCKIGSILSNFRIRLQVLSPLILTKCRVLLMFSDRLNKLISIGYLEKSRQV